MCPKRLFIPAELTDWSVAPFDRAQFGAEAAHFCFCWRCASLAANTGCELDRIDDARVQMNAV